MSSSTMGWRTETHHLSLGSNLTNHHQHLFATNPPRRIAIDQKPHDLKYALREIVSSAVIERVSVRREESTVQELVAVSR